MKIKTIQWLYTLHLIAMVVLFFIELIYAASLRAMIANIEVTGLDPLTYDRPTYNFAIRAVFFCALTIFVGHKTRKRLRRTGVLLMGLGSCFFLLALIMLNLPRYIDIYETLFYWCIYNGSSVILTIIAIINYEKAKPIVPMTTYDDILDDFNEL